MIKMRYRSKDEVESYPDDVTALQEWLAEEGYDVPRQDVMLAWAEHSGAWCAGWLIINHCSKSEAVGYLLECLSPDGAP